MASTLFQYHRDSQRRKRGCLVAVRENQHSVKIGWSLCSRSDKFNPSLGTVIARGRIADEGMSPELPPSMEDSISEFVDRASRYFKTRNIRVVGKDS
jgi:hypothetical protein